MVLKASARRGEKMMLFFFFLAARRQLDQSGKQPISDCIDKIRSDRQGPAEFLCFRCAPSTSFDALTDNRLHASIGEAMV